MPKKKNIITVVTDPKKNTLRVLMNAISEGTVRDFLIVGKYTHSDDYFIMRTDMSSTEEINMAAQLQSAVNIRVTDECIGQGLFDPEE